MWIAPQEGKNFSSGDWDKIFMEGNALAGTVSQMFERLRKGNSHKDCGIEYLLPVVSKYIGEK